MEVILLCDNYVQVDALTVVDFTMLYVVTQIKSYLFCYILESAVVRSEMEVVLLCENIECYSIEGSSRRFKGPCSPKRLCALVFLF